MSEVVIISGPPGSGKTTLALALASSWHSKAVHLHTDEFYGAIKTGMVQPWEPESQTQNGVVMDVIAASSLAYAKGGYTTFAEGVIGPWFLSHFQLEVPTHYIVLLPSLEVTFSRLRARNSDFQDEDVAAMLHGKFREAAGPFNPIQANGSLSEVREQVTKAIKKGTHLLNR